MKLENVVVGNRFIESINDGSEKSDPTKILLLFRICESNNRQFVFASESG